MKLLKTTGSVTHVAPARVRHEPPTIIEATEAARDLASDLQQQVDIVAGLMGIAHQEAKEHVATHPVRQQAISRSFSTPERARTPGSRNQAKANTVILAARSMRMW